MVQSIDKVQNKELQVINLQQKPEINEKVSYIHSKQSANALFKFMGKLDYLKDILKKKAIIPRYYEEKIDYLNIEGIDKIAFPMSCFCDIHINKLVPHMVNYGSYGIGLSKEWGIEQGIQPIHYINKLSHLSKDFSQLFNNSFNMQCDERKKYSHYNNYLLHELFYMKPLEGQMIVNNKYEERNFHDEKEWRFIPSFDDVDTELPMVIDKEQMNPKSYNVFSQGISLRPELWLKFDFDAIKYIIVRDHDDRKDLLEFINNNQIEKNEYERYILFSKIIVFNELKEDW